MPTNVNSTSNQLTMEKKMRAIGYARVSSEKQNDEGYSIDNQRKSIVDYISAKDFECIEIYDEEEPASKVKSKDMLDDFDLSKGLKNRKVLSAIVEAASRKEFDCLVVYSRDRLSRVTGQYLALKKFFRDNDIEIHFSKSGENLNLEDEKYNKLLEVILASYAELEAEVIGLRVKSGSRTCVKKGNKPGGNIPYGFKRVPKAGRKFTIEPSYYQMNNVKEIFSLYNNYGYGYRKIAKMMNQYNNTDWWNKGIIESILKNESYSGYIVWDRRGGRRNPGKHKDYLKFQLPEDDAYIDEEVWVKTENLRKRKAEIKDPRYFNTPFLLKDKLICGRCGQSKMVTRNNGKNMRVYRCTKIENGKSELILSQDLLDSIFVNSFKNLFSIESVDKIWELYDEYYQELKKAIEKVVQERKKELIEIKALSKGLDKLIGRSLDDGIIRRVKEQKVLCDREKAAMEDEIKSFVNRLNNHIRSKKEFINIVGRITKEFDKLTDETKRMIVDVILDKIYVDEVDGKINMKMEFNIPRYIV